MLWSDETLGGQLKPVECSCSLALWFSQIVRTMGLGSARQEFKPSSCPEPKKFAPLGMQGEERLFPRH